MGFLGGHGLQPNRAAGCLKLFASQNGPCKCHNHCCGPFGIASAVVTSSDTHHIYISWLAFQDQQLEVQ